MEAQNEFNGMDGPYCRLCLTVLRRRHHRELLTNQVFVGMIEGFTNVKIGFEDEHSKRACLHCWNLLAKIKKFRNVIQNSDFKLKTRFIREIPQRTYSNSRKRNTQRLEKTNSDDLILGMTSENGLEADLDEQVDVKEELIEEKSGIFISELNMDSVEQELDGTLKSNAKLLSPNKFDILISDTELINSGNDQNYCIDLPLSNIIDKSINLSNSESEEEELENEPSKIDINELNLPEIKSDPNNVNSKLTPLINNEPHSLSTPQEDSTNSKMYCSFCDKNFNLYCNYIKHVCSHTGTYPYNCTECNKGFVTGKALYDHKKVACKKPVEPKKSVTFKCNICTKIFSFDYYHQHMQEHLKNLTCSHCNESFKSKHELNKHVKTVHPESKKPGLCDICGKRIVNLTEHRKSHSKPYKCNLCHMSYGHKDMYIAHINKHEKKTYKCGVCQKELCSKKTLYYHKLAIHTDNKRFKCEYCEKRFHFKQSLLGHIRSIHYK